MNTWACIEEGGDVERIIHEEHIACDFERLPGYLVSKESGVKLSTVTGMDEELETERDTLHSIGQPDVVRVPKAPLPRFDTGQALRFPRQGQFHPRNYQVGLYKAIKARGGRVFAARMTRYEASQKPDRVTISTDAGHVVTAKHIVLGTNMPVQEHLSYIAKLEPYRTYVSAMPIPRTAISALPQEPRFLLWDTEDPYHYLRFAPKSDTEDWLIIGGDDHKVTETASEATEQRWHALEAWAKARFPEAGEAAFRWSGQVIETADLLALLGRRTPAEHNIWLITGDSGTGLTHTTIGAMLVSDGILGRHLHPEWSKLYAPDRKTIKALPGMLAHDVEINLAYKRWLTLPSTELVDSPDALAPGQGALCRQGLLSAPLALFKDTDGKVTRKKAICPHMGGIVAWNAVEQSWDCPVHGSRFDAHGHVIQGPAMADLPDAPSESK